MKAILSILLFHMGLYANVRLGILSDSRYYGEREVGWRIKRAAESLGWTVFLDEQRGRELAKIADLDFTICLVPNNRILLKDCPIYLTVFHPTNYLGADGNLNPFYHKYDAFLLTLPSADAFKTRPSIPFYPTVQNVEYKKLTLNDLMTTIPVWSNRITDERFKSLYKMLSHSGFMKFYGAKRIIEEGYVGKLPFDGRSVIDAIQKHGIILILHSSIHNEHHIPSARIFEAAAASAVIICDENAFVKEHFGDSVFYIDATLSSDAMYQQIARCMEQIRADPESALAMAQRAHQIFADRFQMSDQLLRIKELHDQIHPTAIRNSPPFR